MATTNSINNTSNPLSTTQMSIDSDGSGDAFVQFNINSTNEWIFGADDTDSDSVKISQGGTLGTNDYWIMDSNGIRSLPLQPSFLASCGAEANASGDDTNHTIGSITATTEIFDQNSDFSPGNGSGTGASYTAPIGGPHYFSYILTWDIDGTGGDETTNSIVTSNRTYDTVLLPTENRLSNFFGPNNDVGQSSCIIADMDAADTCEFKWKSGTAGSKVDDIVEGFIGGSLLA